MPDHIRWYPVSESLVFAGRDTLPLSTIEKPEGNSPWNISVYGALLLKPDTKFSRETSYIVELPSDPLAERNSGEANTRNSVELTGVGRLNSFVVPPVV